MSVPAGARLGPYEVRGLLGAGGMGEVYLAWDERLGREVAVKVLPSTTASDPDRRRRFEQEAKAAGALHHPNLVAVLKPRGLLDAHPVYVRAVCAAKVFDDVEIATAGDYRMLAVGIDVVEGNLIGRLAANDHPVLVDREFPSSSTIRAINQLRHAASFENWDFQ